MNEQDPVDGRAIRPNKSQQKREIAARTELVEKMTGLTDRELERLGLSDDMIEEVGRVRAIKPSGARKRQLKHCVKYLQDADLSQVELYLADRQSQQVGINQALHRLERWRDRLIAEGDQAMQDLLSELPMLDRQQLRQMVRDAQREREQGKPAGAGRKLFRHLRELFEADTEIDL